MESKKFTNPKVQLLLVFVISLIVLGIIQFSTPNIVGNDGYYHIKIAQLMRERSLVFDFTWLPLTILNANNYFDHHFLYHVFLIPFSFGDLAMGAKMASVIFPSLMVAAVFGLLKSQKIPFAFLWSLAVLAISEAFLYRILMPRAQIIALIYLLAAVFLLIRGKFKLLFPLGFVFVWTYDAFPLLLLVIIIFSAIEWLYEKKLDLRAISYGLGGIVAGMIVNPFFPKNLLFIWNHITPKLFDPTATAVGSEWYPYKTTQLVENSGFTFLLLVIGIFALGWAKEKMSKTTAFTFGLSILFGFMLFQSRRFIEYFPAMVLLFTAFSVSELYQSGETKVMGGRAKYLPAIFLGLILLGAMSLNVAKSMDSVADTRPIERYREASLWLAENSSEGDRVFQTDWDDFPQLFFYNHSNTYTIGLDPTYMEFYDDELFNQWVELTKGRVEKPSALISELFSGDYALTDLSHVSFIQKALEDKDMEVVYQDKYSMIFAIGQLK